MPPLLNLFHCVETTSSGDRPRADPPGHPQMLFIRTHLCVPELEKLVIFSTQDPAEGRAGTLAILSHKSLVTRDRSKLCSHVSILSKC